MEAEELEILVQEEVSKFQHRNVFAKISTTFLGVEDVVRALSEVIDDKTNGYYQLPFLSASSIGMERLDVSTSIRKQRADSVYVVSNGRNTIYILDYVVKTHTVYHDPVVYIIGPDALKIAESTLKNLKRVLLPKTYKITLNEDALSDYSNLTGQEKMKTIKRMSSIFEEAELALKMEFLNETSEPQRNLKETSDLSETIIKDARREKARIRTGFMDTREITVIGLLMILLMIVFFVVSRI